MNLFETFAGIIYLWGPQEQFQVLEVFMDPQAISKDISTPYFFFKKYDAVFGLLPGSPIIFLVCNGPMDS